MRNYEKVEYKTAYWGTVEIIKDEQLEKLFDELNFHDFTDEQQMEIFAYINCEYKPQKILFGIDAITGSPIMLQDWGNTFSFEENTMVVKWSIEPFTQCGMDRLLGEEIEDYDEIDLSLALDVLNIDCCEQEYQYLIDEGVY